MNLLVKKEYFKSTNIFKKVKYYFLLIMLSCLFVRNIGVYAFVPPVIDLIVFSLLGAIGVLILSWGIVSKNINIDFKNNLFLLLFLGAVFISALANIKYGFFQNIKDFFWTAISFFLVYMFCKEENLKERELFLHKIQNMIILFWSILSSISIITAILQMSYIFYVRDSWIGIGIVEDRLFGVFVNPNSAGIVAFLALIFSVYQIFSKNKKNIFLRKEINIANIIIQYVYISLSESRGCCMILILATALVSSIVFYKKINLGKNDLLKKIYSVIFGLIFSIFILFSILFITKVFSLIPNLFLNSSGNVVINKPVISQRKDYINNNDISNLRFQIWLSAWEIFKTKWLFGTSAGNLVNYAKDVLPQTFIAKRMYTRTHNIWIGVLLYTGITGGICWFAFFAKCFFKLLKHYLKIGIYKSQEIFNLSALILICICAYGMVESEMLFVNSVCSFIFWTFFGYLSHYLNKKEVL